MRGCCVGQWTVWPWKVWFLGLQLVRRGESQALPQPAESEPALTRPLEAHPRSSLSKLPCFSKEASPQHHLLKRPELGALGLEEMGEHLEILHFKSFAGSILIQQVCTAFKICNTVKIKRMVDSPPQVYTVNTPVSWASEHEVKCTPSSDEWDQFELKDRGT